MSGVADPEGKRGNRRGPDSHPAPGGEKADLFLYVSQPVRPGMRLVWPSLKHEGKGVAFRLNCGRIENNCRLCVYACVCVCRCWVRTDPSNRSTVKPQVRRCHSLSWRVPR